MLGGASTKKIAPSAAPSGPRASYEACQAVESIPRRRRSEPENERRHRDEISMRRIARDEGDQAKKRCHQTGECPVAGSVSKLQGWEPVSEDEAVSRFEALVDPSASRSRRRGRSARPQAGAQPDEGGDGSLDGAGKGRAPRGRQSGGCRCHPPRCPCIQRLALQVNHTGAPKTRRVG